MTGSNERDPNARDRILQAAAELFYRDGTGASGVDALVERANVAKATFYRHFPSKDHLITAYLAGRLERDQDQLNRLRRDHHDDSRAVLAGLADVLAQQISSPGFRGCPYANLTAEYCDVDHPARDIAGRHRSWLLREVEQLLEDVGVGRAHIVAEQLVMLRAGAMAVASVGSTQNVDAAFAQAWAALIDQPA